MNKKNKMAFCLAGFLALIFFSLNAEAGPILNDEKPVKDVVKKVYPSVVRVEVRNGIRKVATGVIIDKDGHIVTTALISPREEEIFITTSDGEKNSGRVYGYGFHDSPGTNQNQRKQINSYILRKDGGCLNRLLDRSCQYIA